LQGDLNGPPTFNFIHIASSAVTVFLEGVRDAGSLEKPAQLCCEPRRDHRACYHLARRAYYFCDRTRGCADRQYFTTSDGLVSQQSENDFTYSMNSFIINTRDGRPLA
jgi:hypothetical protein